MKKVMWIALFLEILTLIVIVVLCIIKVAIPDLIFWIFVISLAVTILSSIFVASKNNKFSDNELRVFKWKHIILIVLPIIILTFLIFTILSR